MNGNAHFASVGDAPNAAKYEHGVQVIDEDKQFRFVYLHFYFILFFIVLRDVPSSWRAMPILRSRGRGGLGIWDSGVDVEDRC